VENRGRWQVSNSPFCNSKKVLVNCITWHITGSDMCFLTGRQKIKKLWELWLKFVERSEKYCCLVKCTIVETLLRYFLYVAQSSHLLTMILMFYDEASFDDAWLIRIGDWTNSQRWNWFMKDNNDLVIWYETWDMSEFRSLMITTFWHEQPSDMNVTVLFHIPLLNDHKNYNLMVIDKHNITKQLF